MDRILIILKKENDPRASSASALGLNAIIFQYVCWYMQQTQVSVYRTIGPLVLFLLQNIDCGYSLELPRRGGSDVYPRSIFLAKILKISKIFS